MSDDREEPWLRQPDEPSFWFNRFDRYYRPVGPDRSILNSYNRWRAVKGRDKRPGKRASSAWARAFKRYNWFARAQAWDDYQTELRHQEEKKERNEARKERKAMIRVLKAELSKFLNDHREVLLSSRDPSLHEIVRFAEMVLHEERAEMDDEPTNRLDLTTAGEQVRVLGIDLSKL